MSCLVTFSYLHKYPKNVTNRNALDYRSRALKSLSKLKAAIWLRAALEIFLLHQNLSLFTVTFGEKVLTLAKSRGS